MSDELDDLKAAMTAATPRPDAARKAADLALAEENFARFQGSADARRPMSERGPMAALDMSEGNDECDDNAGRIDGDDGIGRRGTGDDFAGGA